MRRKVNWGSIITGAFLGALIGLYLSMLIPSFFIYSEYVIGLLSVILFSLLAYKKPIFTEFLAYGISIYIILQYGWDYVVGDRGNLRASLFFMGAILLFINIFSGHIRLVGAKKTFRRAIGLG